MLTQILRNLTRRKTRTLLTVAGIAIGVAAIVAMGAIGEGMRTGYASMFSGSDADLTIMQKGAFDITMSAVDEQVVAQVASLPEVKATTGMVVGNVQAPNTPYFFVFGYDPNGFAIERFKIETGQRLGASRHATQKSREILLGKQAAQVMKLTVGDSVRLTGGTFQIVGIYNTGSGFEDSAAVLALSDAQQLLQKQRLVGAVQIKLKDARQADKVRERLERQYPRLTISQSSQVADQQEMVSMIQGMAWGIALLAIVIGGVGMTNTVLMSAFERTREVGTLRAMGWSRQRVMLMVLGESMALGLVGGMVGCLLGATLITLMSQNTALVFLQGQVSLALLLQGIFTAVVLGGVGGIYPAWWASRLLPSEAMRYESGAAPNLKTLPLLNRINSETLKSLLRRRGRTALTVVGISMGLAAVMALGGMVDGFTSEFNQMIGGSDIDLMIRQESASDMGYSAISERAGRMIAAIPGVQSVSGIILSAMTLENDAVPYVILMAYAPQDPALRHFKIIAGRGLTGSREILLGRPAAEILNVRAGNMLRLGEVSFRVVGLYETGVAWEEGGGVISLRDGQALFGKPRQVSLYGVKLHDPQQAQAISQQIEANVPDVAVTLSSEFVETLPDMQTTNMLMGFISALAVFVGGIGMMNTMFMSVFERTREIGTLRALGWGRGRILIMVIKESLLLSLIGIIAGTALTVMLNEAILLVPLWGEMLKIVFSLRLVGQALLVAILLGVVGGAYPAWRAANLSPVEALRYE